MVFLSWRNGAAITTVDHADIRGLITACLAFVVELPLAHFGSSAGWPDPHNSAEDSPAGAAPSISGNFTTPFFENNSYALISTVRAIAHINAANSLAMAVITSWLGLPLAKSLLHRAHSLT